VIELDVDVAAVTIPADVAGEARIGRELVGAAGAGIAYQRETTHHCVDALRLECDREILPRSGEERVVVVITLDNAIAQWQFAAI